MVLNTATQLYTMSLKSISKTRWKIETDRVTVYPYSVFYLFTAIIAVLFTGLLLIYMNYQHAGIGESLPFVLLLLLIVVLFWGFAATYIEFDLGKARMRKMLMGFIPVNTIPLSKLQGINSVSNMAGSYNYRLFEKNSRFGKGIIVSSGYTKADDPNAIAFVEEAVPIIHGYLDQYDTPADNVKEKITSFRFFTQQGDTYTIKNKKIGAIIFGLFFLAIGIVLLNVETNGILAKVFIVVFTVFLAVIFFNAAYTKIALNTTTKTISRTGLAKFLNRSHHFVAFAGIQTVRRSLNFIYIGTDVNLYFEVAGKNGKQDIITIISLKKSADIERFVEELYQIMEI
ncbi:hypothetical protein GCM10011425_28730 [Mucilaginibacter galii]|uniref:Uncharacterized protein n=2 Tax=Mucilaginibacter galii TaxID=2005073 RepID=A0A917JAJ1_9SPHI|nr:hypothetical protein GCM10011425_28730 [Mucilaginibacter galii]